MCDVSDQRQIYGRQDAAAQISIFRVAHDANNDVAGTRMPDFIVFGLRAAEMLPDGISTREEFARKGFANDRGHRSGMIVVLVQRGNGGPGRRGGLWLCRGGNGFSRCIVCRSDGEISGSKCAASKERNSHRGKEIGAYGQSCGIDVLLSGSTVEMKVVGRPAPAHQRIFRVADGSYSGNSRKTLLQRGINLRRLLI